MCVGILRKNSVVMTMMYTMSRREKSGVGCVTRLMIFAVTIGSAMTGRVLMK